MIDAYEQKTNYKLPLSDALFCAQDWKRNEKFFEAIFQAIQDLKEKHETVRVIDAGAGIGVLGFFALLAGADEVVFLEHNPETLALCKLFLKQENFLEKATFKECDASTIVLDKKYHLLVSETLSKNIQEEDFLRIIPNLLPFLEEDGILLPEKIEVEQNGTKNTFETKKISTQLKGNLSKIILYKNIQLDRGECQSILNY